MADHAQFEASTDQIRAALNTALDAAEPLLPLLAAVTAAIQSSGATVATLRRASIEPGPMNSVAAVAHAHRGLTSEIADVERHLHRLFEIADDLRTMHPQAVAVLKAAKQGAP